MTLTLAMRSQLNSVFTACKVNAVTKPDSFPLPHMDNCIDQVSSVKFVNKFNLLKGYW